MPAHAIPKTFMPLRLLLERREVNVCLEDPCLEVDRIVSAHLVDFYQLWLGRLSYLDARRKGLVELSGPPALERARFPTWLQWNPMATTVQHATERSG